MARRFSGQTITVSEAEDGAIESQRLLENQTDLSLETFCGFRVAGCDLETGPIFNYARFWSHLTAVAHVVGAFKALIFNQIEKQTVSGAAWNESDRRKNLEGSPEVMSKYIFRKCADQKNLAVHGAAPDSALANQFSAAMIAMVMQWSSTGSAMLTAYK